MKLISEVQLPDYPFKIDHHTPLMMMGSCFTENIGKQLMRYLFPVCINPYGVTYNPLSVKKGLDALLERDTYRMEDLDHYNDLWFSFDHYTKFSSPHQEEALAKINGAFRKAKEMMPKVQYLIITWGTAWVYRYNPTGEVVCNCHKIPASQFTRSRLSADEITRTYESLIPQLLALNPHMKILLTVSPVRHWKDGAHGNQLSKATLLLAAESLINQFPEHLFYFPSYEIVMDELRDYRFYSEDLVHINPLATTYIWEKFKQSLLSGEARHIIQEISPLLKLLEHRPLNQEGESYQKLLILKAKKRDTLQTIYPFLSWKNLPSD